MPLLRPQTAFAVSRASATGAAGTAVSRPLHTTGLRLNDQNGTPIPDGLEDGRARGRTGGGEALSSSSANAPPQPKISNLSVPGTDSRKDMTEEQRREVDEHNEDFSKKHDRSQAAPSDKVNKKYWSGEARGRD